jgi:hypothetical protein
MKKNYLFGLLTHLITGNKNFELLNGIRPVLDTTVEGKNYYRVQLPLDHMNAAPYKLIEAHLSIYQYTDQKVNVLSATHLTAVFKLNGEDYRLHVFLNEKEQIASEAHWDKYEEGTYTRLKKTNEINDLIYMLMEGGLPLLQELRTQNKRAVEQLVRDYEAQELIASELSKEYFEHKDEYLASLTEAHRQVQKLSLISNNLQWQNLSHYFHHLIKTVQQSSQPVIEEVSEATADDMPTAVLSMERTSEKPKRDVVKKEATRTDGEFRKLIAQYETFNSTHNKTKQIDLLVILQQDVTLMLTGIIHSLTIKQMKQLKEIDRDLNNKAKGILQRALMDSDFATAVKMKAFFSLVSYDLINIALMVKNADLIAFLIDKMDFPVDTYPITINKEKFKNLMQYCYFKADKEDFLVQVMSILVARDCSLMQPLEPGGLPIAHLILSATPLHPLISALEKNREKTLDNESFYSQLLLACERFKRTHQLIPSAQEEFDESLRSYQSKLDTVRINHLFQSKEQKKFSEIEVLGQEVLGEDFTKKLIMDPEVAAKKKKLEEKCKIVTKNSQDLAKKNKNYRFAYKSMLAQNIDNIRDTLLKTTEQSDLTYQEIKELALFNINRVLDIYDKLIELTGLQKELIGKQQIMGKKNKGFNKMANREKALVAEIQDMQQLLPQNLSKLLTESNPLEEQLVLVLSSLKSLSFLNRKISQILNGSANNVELDSEDDTPSLTQ